MGSLEQKDLKPFGGNSGDISPIKPDWGDPVYQGDHPCTGDLPPPGISPNFPVEFNMISPQNEKSAHESYRVIHIERRPQPSAVNPSKLGNSDAEEQCWTSGSRPTSNKFSTAKTCLKPPTSITVTRSIAQEKKGWNHSWDRFQDVFLCDQKSPLLIMDLTESYRVLHIRLSSTFTGCVS